MKRGLKLIDLKNIICEIQTVSELVTAEYEKTGTELIKAVCEHLTKAVKAAEPILKASYFAYRQTDLGELIFYIFANDQQRDLSMWLVPALKHADFYVFQEAVGNEWTNLSNYDCNCDECSIVFTLKPKAE